MRECYPPFDKGRVSIRTFQNGGWARLSNCISLMKAGILSAIGNTALVKLTKLLPNIQFELFAKYEGSNPGGSIKDRSASFIIDNALKNGVINATSTIIESSSGNMGIGLAQVCAYYGLSFICVVDPKTTQQNMDILRAYGAIVEVVTEPDPLTGEFLPARIARVKSLLRSVENSYWTNQYSNINNANAHHQTMREIESALGGKADYLFCSTGTCGTIRGCADYIRTQKLSTKIIAVDAVGSVIFGGRAAKRLIPGHGAALVPDLYEAHLAARVVYLSDRECVIGCRRLVKREGILAGGSSGAVVMAVERIKQEIPPGANCVIILPDRGERYLDTIYSDLWVKNNFGVSGEKLEN